MGAIFGIHSRYNTFGDQIALFAAANLFNINIEVISTLGPGAEHLFEPSSSVPLGTVFLGHFAASVHCESLVPWFGDSQNAGPECDGKSVQGAGSHSETDGDTRKIDEIESDTAGVGGSRDIAGLRGRRVDRNRVGESDSDGVGGSGGNMDGAGRNSEDTGRVGGSTGDRDKELQNEVESGYSQQFLNNDVLETIIKITLLAFPFMRSSLRAVNSFFRATVKKTPCPEVHIPELGERSVVISIRKLLMLKGKCSSTVQRLGEVINSPKWNHAWVKLVPREYGWFEIAGIFCRNTGNTNI